jgi:hypothetical protein
MRKCFFWAIGPDAEIHKAFGIRERLNILSGPSRPKLPSKAAHAIACEPSVLAFEESACHEMVVAQGAI